jgi:hypothetical protein
VFGGKGQSLLQDADSPLTAAPYVLAPDVLLMRIVLIFCFLLVSWALVTSFNNVYIIAAHYRSWENPTGAEQLPPIRFITTQYQ